MSKRKVVTDKIISVQVIRENQLNRFYFLACV